MTSSGTSGDRPNTATLLRSLGALRDGQHFRNYERAREAVLACMAEMAGPSAAPSAYWQAELGGFDYLFDASPLIVEKLREHCHHITGISPYRYRTHHAHEVDQFEAKLSKLKRMDVANLLVGEDPVLGGFGHRIDGALVNLDTLKFFECLIALDRAGVLDAVKADAGRRETWLEIGAGWGGFGAAVKKRFPSVNFVMVDLPQTLLFSGTYLQSAFPDARIVIYPERSLEDIQSNIADFDFVLLPHYLFDRVSIKIDLAVNIASFQEMTSGQVAHYLERLKAIGSRRLYSLNRDESSNNLEITTVSAIIEQHFAPPKRVRMLDYSHMTLVPPKGSRPSKKPKGLAKILGLKPKTPPAPPPTPASVRREYRHLVAELPA